MGHMDKNNIKKAFVKSLPILCSYIFVGMAFGIMMEAAGFKWYVSSIISIVVYTGAFQFVMITLLSTGASVFTVVVTAILMNSRQSFYAIAFIDEFSKMGRRKPYMISSMTDETFAVNCSLTEKGDEKRDIMYYVAVFSKTYWVIGCTLGGIIGQLIPFELNGIDFCMTALFVIIFIDQWEKAESHIPAVVGLVVSVICLLVVGEDYFLLPSLILASGILIIWNSRREEAQS